MRKILLFIFLLSVTAAWMVGCGDSGKKIVPAQTTSFAFLQAAPGAGYGFFSPALGVFSTNGSNTTFSTQMYVDTGTNQTITMAIGSLVLSADSKIAAFDLYGGTGDVSTGQWDIWSANADGTGTLRQISNDVYEDAFPQFSPDGTKVVYASYQPVPGDTSGSYQWQIVVTNSSGAAAAQVLPIPEGILYQMHPSYSPDGTKLVMMAAGYIGGMAVDGIMVTNADGTNAQMLSNPLYSETCYYCVDELPVFTSDGKITFSRDDWNSDVEFEDIFIMNADGTNQNQLTDNVGLNSDPLFLSISGVGDRLLFSSNRDNPTAGDAGFDIYSIKTDGTGLTRLTNNTLYDAFSAWWYEGTESSALRHTNLLSRQHTVHRATGMHHRVVW